MQPQSALPSRSQAWALTLAAALLLAIACNKGGDPPKKSADAGALAADIESACDKRETLGLCIDHTKAAFATGEDFVRSACTGTEGRYLETPCPSDARVGSCTFGSGQIRSYYGGGGRSYSAAEARRDCEQTKGKWSVPGRGDSEL